MFTHHLTLISTWLDRRRDVVVAVEARLLNVRDKPLSRSRDRRLFEAQLSAAFFQLPGMPAELARLKGHLEAQRASDGLEPTVLDNFVHQLDPLELVIRAYEHWNRTRWPGSSARLACAQTLFSAFVLRYLELLCLRLWDDGDEAAGAHLSALQQLLDRTNSERTAAVFVRDARWLVQTAQGPFTEQLVPYFRIATRVATLRSDDDRVAIHRAGALLVGGHLRSQRRYGTWRTGLGAHDPEIVAFTRNSNAMDHALLLRDLVGLLRSYRQAITDGVESRRVELADAILQGIAVDPELFLVRLDLLLPYVQIEPLSVATEPDGGASLTAFGVEQASLCDTYRSLLSAVIVALVEDARGLEPEGRAYSPFGVVYGFAADILSNIAMDALVGHPAHGQSLEDVFDGRHDAGLRRAKAEAWRRLPLRTGEREHFEHADEYGRDVYARLVESLRLRAAHPDQLNASGQQTHVIVVAVAGDPSRPGFRTGDEAGSGLAADDAVVSGQQFLLTTDQARAAATNSTYHERAQLMKERNEGGYLASAEIDGQWWAITKTVLTFATLQSQGVLLRHVPRELVEPLSVMCPEIVIRS